jgi:hypothetical protein
MAATSMACREPIWEIHFHETHLGWLVLLLKSIIGLLPVASSRTSWRVRPDNALASDNGCYGRIVSHSENAVDVAVSHSRLLPIIRKDGKILCSRAVFTLRPQERRYRSVAK